MDNKIRGQFEMVNYQLKELSSIYKDMAAKFGISDNELWIWYTLIVLDKEYSQQEICEMWYLPKQTVNSVISNMRKKGFVFLDSDVLSKNRKIIRLSDEGKAFGKKMIENVILAEQRALETLSEEERQMCIELIGRYIKALKIQMV